MGDNLAPSGRMAQGEVDPPLIGASEFPGGICAQS
jgi:hypothetical protein